MSKIECILKKIKTNKTLQYIVIGIISLVIIFIIATIFNNDTKKTNSYAEEIEQKLEKTLSQIDGAGKVKVMVTLDDALPIAYTVKTEKTQNGTITTKTPLTINGEVVFLSNQQQSIAGVLIVAEGAKNLSVFSKLQYATTTLLNIEVSKIEILPYK